MENKVISTKADLEVRDFLDSQTRRSDEITVDETKNIQIESFSSQM